MTYPAPKIIGLCGSKGVGKSTYAKSFEGATILSFATPIKEMLKVILPHPAWLEKKEEPIPGFPDGITVRRMLQELGTSFGRETIYPNLWVDIAMRKAEDHLGRRLIIFDDIRFPNEAWAIKRLGHRHEILTQIVHISRKGHEPDENDLHVSEAGLPKYFIDKWVTVDDEGEATE
jgi:hypothetical protein